MKYLVEHPNFGGWFLRKPSQVPPDQKDPYNEPPKGVSYSCDTHDWVDKELATQYDSEDEARRNFTSPLCDIVTF